MPPEQRSTAKHSRPGDALGARIKGWEAASETAMPPDRPFVIRLDGVAFRNYTKGMTKPFDPRCGQSSGLGR